MCQCVRVDPKWMLIIEILLLCVEDNYMSSVVFVVGGLLCDCLLVTWLFFEHAVTRSCVWVVCLELWLAMFAMQCRIACMSHIWPYIGP